MEKIDQSNVIRFPIERVVCDPPDGLYKSIHIIQNNGEMSIFVDCDRQDVVKLLEEAIDIMIDQVRRDI